jgi:IstB-like ATP binding protein
LICDELEYVTMSRGDVELLFRVFGDRYKRGSILVTSNLPFRFFLLNFYAMCGEVSCQ